ncbi:hypothetical protein P0W64_20150 [Tsukamurella sp. 8F]|uniref:hypothetical protein n=1 Tax=unclassified Tsukamurella TaxID=2633480 RepID=UPI0023B8E02A|nr:MULTISPECIES: hypothetical protein [unclassified Tsukamurella]MDF0531824.1 hypothetical protein [Tsukamurella sp. 8J]MDF0589098.1 hypothetical protein [Tsukamurella sp. 8F]
MTATISPQETTTHAYPFWVGLGTACHEVEATIWAFGQPADAWCHIELNDGPLTDPEFPFRLIVAGPGGRAFAAQIIPHLRRVLGAELLGERDYFHRSGPAHSGDVHDDVDAGAVTPVVHWMDESRQGPARTGGRHRGIAS